MNSGDEEDLEIIQEDEKEAATREMGKSPKRRSLQSRHSAGGGMRETTAIISQQESRRPGTVANESEADGNEQDEMAS